MPAAASASAAHEDRIRDLEQQLHTLQATQDGFLDHYRALEGVCWDVLDDLASATPQTQQGAKGEGGRISEDAERGESPARDAAVTAPAARPSSVAGHTHEDHPYGPSLSFSPGQPRASPLTTSKLSLAGTGNAIATSSSPHRRQAHAAPALVVPQDDAYLLLHRLRTLQRWMADLQLHVAASAEATLRRLESQTVAPSTPARSYGRTAASGRAVCAAGLHRAVDDVFVTFTQLQTTLTDVVWGPAHPPAPSTPARTRQDRDVEVTRLRAINQELRRTLRAYELAHRGTRPPPHAAPLSSVASPRRSPPPPPPPAPSGYVAAAEPGLFTAAPRRR